VIDSAYSRWRTASFPAGGVSETIDAAHADLAYWDAMVADTIVPITESGAAYDSGALDLSAGLSAFRQKLSEEANRAAPDEAAVFADYAQYTELMIAANAEAMGLT
jgi:hypothetical protein